MAMNSAVMAAIRMAVFIRLNMRVPTPVDRLHREMRPRGTSSSRRAETPSRQRGLCLQERPGGHALSARLLQLVDPQRLLAGRDHERIVGCREQLAGLALRVDHLAAPYLEGLAIEHRAGAGERVERPET